jgi:hypothetical protein
MQIPIAKLHEAKHVLLDLIAPKSQLVVGNAFTRHAQSNPHVALSSGDWRLLHLINSYEVDSLIPTVLVAA